MSSVIWTEGICLDSRHARPVRFWASAQSCGVGIQIYEETEKRKEITESDQSSWEMVTRYVFAHPGEAEKSEGIECVSGSIEEAKARVGSSDSIAVGCEAGIGGGVVKTINYRFKQRCGVKIVTPKNVIFGTDLLWLLKAACNISIFLLMKRISTLEEVKTHIEIHEKPWAME